ncbi:MAG TPA: MATE family efflux transporter [Candidatus Fimimorpha faecalis]|uniref:Probable multidrug resistance protein NorM n=1 Tax=Candidatus Fimimorpha faecalis TaxID=2840824 RepID=A0A9D1EC19_9FIRM|nr:MATE family efflux transporter [Candidatus Fimimorpha faecalis]
MKVKNSLINKMISLLFPLILTNTLNVLTYIINSIWIGKLIGENGIAVITNCYPMTVILSAVISAFVSAISVIVSQYYGSKDSESIKHIMGFGYLFSFILGILIMWIVIAFSEAFLRLLGTPKHIFGDTKIYLLLYVIGFVVNFVLLLISESVRALGNVKLPLIFVGIETILNIGSVPIFILNGFGTAGVAVANLIAKMVVLVLSIVLVRKKYSILKLDKRYLRIRKVHLKRVLQIGVPIMLEQCIIALVISLETSISNKAGIIGNAAYGVAIKWEQVFLVISQSLQTVITILVGQSVGRKELSQIHVILKNGIKLSIFPIGLIILITFGIPEFFCGIFINNENVIQVAVQYLSVAGFAYILMPVRMMLNGFIIGTAHTRYLLFSSVIASGVEIIVMYILLHIGCVESMIVLAFSALTYVIIDTAFSSAFYFSGLWKKKLI